MYPSQNCEPCHPECPEVVLPAPPECIGEPCVEITLGQCVRYTGIAIPCLNIANGENLNSIISKISAKVCEEVPVVEPAIPFMGTNYLYVYANGTDVENATELQNVYNQALTMSPSISNRITVIAGPGRYNFTSNFTMNTEFVDLVSLDGNRSIIFNGTGTIYIEANDVYVKGVDVQNKSFEVASSKPLQRIVNSKGGNFSLGANGGFILAGIFIDCEMGNNSFCGANNTTLSGTFINCIAGNESFGSVSSSIQGIFTNCKAGNYSFGADFSTLSGTFTDCKGLETCFGPYGTASGIFTRCEAFGYSFGRFGTLTGQLYFCRLSNLATYETVSLSGKTLYCIDGSNNPNNQGFISQNKL